MSSFTYRGRRVVATKYADIQNHLRVDGPNGNVVQKLLDEIEPWKDGEDPIQTGRFPGTRIYPMAIESKGFDVIWGIHRGHHARQPRLSPFIVLDRYMNQRDLGLVTIELTGTPREPLLARAYGGDYTPPLPWMTSSKLADGGRSFCQQYWRTHAYLDRRGTLIREGTATKRAPEWV